MPLAQSCSYYRRRDSSRTEAITCPASATVANGAEFICLSPVEGDKKIGSVKMQTAAKSNLTLMSFSSIQSYGRLRCRPSQNLNLISKFLKQSSDV